MDFQYLLQQVSAYNNWPLVFTGQSARMEVPTNYGRSQVVECSIGQDYQGNPLVMFWSNIAQTAQIRDPWYLLQLNANMNYGSLAIRGTQLFMMATQLLQTADSNTVMRIISYLALQADTLEQQLVGTDNN